MVLWYQCNRLVHEGKKANIQELVGFIKGFIQEINMLENDILPNRPMIRELWRLPDIGIIKISFDVSFQSRRYPYRCSYSQI